MLTPHPVARCSAQAGFTLVEVLVALAAMALLGSLTWMGLDSVMRSRDAGRNAIDTQVRLLTVMTQWEQDLGALHSTGQVPALEFDGQALRLTRRTDDGVAVVSWALRHGSWQRWAGPTCTQAAELRSSLERSRQLLGNEPGHLMLAHSVADWQVYYFRGGGWSNAQSSGDLDLETVPSSTGSPAAVAPGAASAAVAPGAASAAVAPGAGTAAPKADGQRPPAVTAPTLEKLPEAVRLVITLNGRKLTRTVLLGPTGS